MAVSKDKIRNFCIIAHIDHGKSTLADRLLEKTKSVALRDMTAQLLDKMDLERERGITIKAHAVKLNYTADDGEEYVLNLIDTPGHVDFNYEVSRSLAACEGAVLIIDASQGVEAQTLANTYLALDHDLEIVPVINKIDLPSADPDRVAAEVEDVIGLDCSEAPRISAKTGQNVEQVLERIVKDIPAPKADDSLPCRALIFDSVYDSYKGVIVYVRVKEGKIKPGDTLRMMATGAEFTVVETGYMRATEPEPCAELTAGEVGYITASIKTVGDARVGDTVTTVENPASEPLPGYRKVNPMVFCGIYPADGADYENLRDALEKLQLNDAALSYEPETSGALGFGFRCGFLGLLHMEIVNERLSREFGLDLIQTAPNVTYDVTAEDGSQHHVTNPSEFPDGKIKKIVEPMVAADIITPKEFIGAVMDLCQDHRGIMGTMEYISTDRVEMHYRIPLAEIVFDFFDQLKSRTKGYASLDYHEDGEQSADLVKVDILIQGEKVDAFSAIVHRDKAYSYGVMMTKKLRSLIPRQQFEIPIQAAIGSRIIARENIRALRKDVLAKCYGGDITRKRKLLEKQKAGKKRMKMLGHVEVPQEAFIAALSTGEDSNDRDTKDKIRAAQKTEG